MLLKTNVPLLIFCVEVSGVLKSPITIVLLSIPPFRPVNIHFTYSGAPVFSAYTIVISFCWTDSFIITQHLCLSLQPLL